VWVVPSHLLRSWRSSRRLLAAYRETVTPILHARIVPGPRRTEIEHRLAGWAVQGGYLVESYARLAGVTGVDAVAVVAASFMRLYDDLLDERADGAAIGNRLRRLFAGDEIAPESDVEAVVVDLYKWLAERAPTHHRDELYSYLDTVHQIQLEELEGGDTEAEYIVSRTARKGGAGMAILAGLANPHIEPDEFELLQRLGALLQLIDDYDDAFEDGATTTSESTNVVSFASLATRLHELSHEIRVFYGRRRGRSFVDGLYIWLLLVGLRRLLDRLHPQRLEQDEKTAPRRLLRMLSERKAHIR